MSHSLDEIPPRRSRVGRGKKEKPKVGHSEHARRSDVFPTTMRTWLGEQIDEGDVGRAKAFHHVMSVYADPLKVYFMGCSMRWLGDPDDIVQGFFADRLAREAFLDRWRQSGRPLRYWLIVGFKHYLMEESRRLRKNREASVLPEQVSDADGASGPEAEYDRECAMAMVREAMARAESDCAAAGQSEHWRIMIRHHLEGESYQSIAPDHGIDARRAAVMARTAVAKLKAALRDQAGWDEATPSDVDREIAELKEVLER